MLIAVGSNQDDLELLVGASQNALERTNYFSLDDKPILSSDGYLLQRYEHIQTNDLVGLMYVEQRGSFMSFDQGLLPKITNVRCALIAKNMQSLRSEYIIDLLKQNGISAFIK